MNNFQTILVAIFLAFFVFGVLIFSGVLKVGGGGNSSGISGKLVIWGTLPNDEVSELFENIGGPDSTFTVDYIEKNNDTYEQNLIEAFAQDKGPDLFILSPDMIMKNHNFIYTIPYTSHSEKSFTSTFIDGADMLLTKEGILGYPLLSDPLVLYYNKDMLSNAGILFPPKTWDELFDLTPKLTKKDVDGTIKQSTIALGQYDNVDHAKEILSMMLLQSNNPILTRDDVNNTYRLTIRDSSPDGAYPFEQIVNFFLEFSNPSNVSYTWNRSLPNSMDMFTSNRMAFYVGYASELFKIQDVNPNLSFEPTVVPQTKGTDLKRTYSKMHTIVISKKSKNIASAFALTGLMLEPDFLRELSVRTSLPTNSRTLLAEKQEGSYLPTFFDSTVISRSWLDPNKDSTDIIFKELIENSLSNRVSVTEAISKASNQLDIIVKNNYE